MHFTKSKAEALKKKKSSARRRKHKAQKEKWEKLRLYPFTVFQRSCESHGFYYLCESTNLLLNRLWWILGRRKLFNKKEGIKNQLQKKFLKRMLLFLVRSKGNFYWLDFFHPEFLILIFLGTSSLSTNISGILIDVLQIPEQTYPPHLSSIEKSILKKNSWPPPPPPKEQFWEEECSMFIDIIGKGKKNIIWKQTKS